MLLISVTVLFLFTINASFGYYGNGWHHPYHRHLICDYRGCYRPNVCQNWCHKQTHYWPYKALVCCSHTERPGFCYPERRCLYPAHEFITRGHKCNWDFQCPESYKCCPDSCYMHRICKPSMWHPIGTTPTTSTTSTQRPTEGTTIPGSSTEDIDTSVSMDDPTTTTTTEQTTTRETTTTTPISTTVTITTIEGSGYSTTDDTLIDDEDNGGSGGEDPEAN